MKKYGLLVRISKDEAKKKAINLDAQEARLRDYVKQKADGEVIKVYRGLGHSASFNEDTLVRKKVGRKVIGEFDLIKRKELDEALDDAEKGLITHLIFTKWDRFARNVPFKHLCQGIFEDLGITVESADELNVPLVTNIFMDIAEEDIRKQREKSDDKFLHKFNLGVHPFRAIFGYKGVEKEINGNKMIIMEVVPEQAEIVRNCFKMRSKDAEDKYSIDHNTYSRIIKNKRIYQGEINYKEQWKKGIHEPILK